MGGVVSRLTVGVNSRIGRVLTACLVLAVGGAAAAAAQRDEGVGVLKVRLGGDAKQTRVVVELDRTAQGKLISQDSGKVVVALPQVAVSGDMEGQGAGLVKAWTVESAGGAARIKLDLARPAKVARRFLLAPGDGVTVYRYVIDLSEDTPKPAEAAVAAAKPALERPLPVKAPLQPLTPSKKIVVIDAGHGGKDPGARGSDNREKELTLAAARALRDRLERTGKYKVVLTRDSDVFIPLERRVQIARQANADLFLSLHADSGSDSSLRGATVYTLSEKGADRAARQVGRGEDWIDVSLPGQDEAVNRILLDLTQRGTVNRSGVFAEFLLSRMSKKTQLLQRSHRDAGYMVLLAPDVPAVLVEMGFITNREDERLLADSDRRRGLMDAVADAVDDYFLQDARYAMR
jgi:N-acetylmuramoyl-L-alanine amidase